MAFKIFSEVISTTFDWEGLEDLWLLLGQCEKDMTIQTKLKMLVARDTIPINIMTGLEPHASSKYLLTITKIGRLIENYFQYQIQTKYLFQ